PIEAMACGTPVVCSRAGSLPEVVGDGGLYFDPTEVGSIAATLSKIVCDPNLRDGLASRALDRAARFTWERAARALYECFEELDPKSAGRSQLRRMTQSA